ncbi:enoyl-CoA hydratase [Bacillus sp. MUM 116]|uniref:enoyl-CoA hydratase/isomerase family protein n=1 Tax=Bacillus sp. MUM 116 TaxID=1678002 RepID=UPI0008F5DF70|nr:enoyl-CoA hydratase/isomerase family protein [Bacillus sp. MUM 116]OIK14051.1 enoyl-CoA hydratase [Bacillus sp. MUM 116]
MAYTIEKSEKGYLLFTITRSDKRNAVNYEVMEGLSEAIRLSAAPDVLALVITGEGENAFCSGGDLAVFHLLEKEEDAYSMLSEMSKILYSLLTLPVPTIAIMNGHAVGGGCEIAIACDFRLAREGTKAGFIQGKQAITTGWGGGTILAEKLPNPVFMKLLMDAEIHHAERLNEIGLIDAIYETDPIKACELYLENLLSKDKDVLQAYKQIWIRRWEETKLQERIEKEVRTCARLWESEAHHHYVQMFLNKKSKN